MSKIKDYETSHAIKQQLKILESHLLSHLRNSIKKVGYKAIISYLEDGSLSILVYCNNSFGVFHS